jgi:hypothetical protein
MLDFKSRIFLLVVGVLALSAVVIFLVNKKSAAENNREQMSIIINDIAKNAQTHFNRTGDFFGWEIPGSLRTEQVGTFRERIENNSIVIYAVGKEIGMNGISNVNLESVITGNNASVIVRN